MAAISNLVQQTTDDTGTGNLVLAATPGFRTFDIAFGHGATTDVFYYYIIDPDNNDWEVGIGHMVNSTTLVRDTILSSSNDDNAVDFAAGTKGVNNDLPAEFQVNGESLGAVAFSNDYASLDNLPTLGTLAALNGAPAATITGTTLASNVVNSSLATLGTVTTGVWHGTPVADAYIASASAWNAKQAAITLTTTGTSGAATLIGATLNIPNYAASAAAFNTLTSGVNISATMQVGTGASLSATGSGQIVATGVPAAGITGTTLASNIVTTSITTLGTIISGAWNGTAITDTYISSATTWNAKQAAISLTTTGSGAATFIAKVLNIPDYSTVPVAFSAVGAGTNANALVVGNSGSLTTSGSGTITATAAPAAGITGTTLASNVVTTSITSLGTLSGLAVTSTSATAVVFTGLAAVLTIDGSTASQATGIIIKGAAASGIVTLTAAGSPNVGASIVSTGSGAASVNAGGTGAAQLQTGGSARVSTNGAQVTITPTVSITASIARFIYTAAADVTLTAGTEATAALINMSATRQHASNTIIATQRDMYVRGSTHSFVTAGGVITLAAAFSVDASTGGTNANLTAVTAIYVPGINVGNATASYGAYIVANSGASANYAAYFGGLTGLGVLAPTAYCSVAASTTANASINVPSGTAPTSPISGDMWFDGTDVKFRVGGSTKTFTLI